MLRWVTIAAALLAQGDGSTSRCDGDTFSIRRCLASQYEAAEADLHVEYRDALSRVAEGRRAALVKAQQAWIAFRDADCAVAFAHAGTVSVVLGGECLVDLTRARTRELRDLATDGTT